MEEVKKFAGKHIYIFAVGFTLITILLSPLLFNLTGGKPDSITAFYLKKLLIELIPIALVTTSAFVLNLIGKKDFSVKGFGKGLLFGIPLILLSLVLGNVLFLLTSGQARYDDLMLTLLLFISFYFVVGLSEEILYRGFLLNLLRNKHGSSGKGLVRAVLLSSFMFGVAHFMNLIYGASFISTIGQVLYSTFIAVFFCAVYIRVGSLLPLILIHALFNIFTGLNDLFFTGDSITPPVTEPPQAEPLLSYFIVPMITLVFALYGLFLIRKQLRSGNGG
jgi:hypothetical protein